MSYGGNNYCARFVRVKMAIERDYSYMSAGLTKLSKSVVGAAMTGVALIALSSCADPATQSPTPPASVAPKSAELPADVSAALHGIESTALDSLYLAQAGSEFVKQCLADRGVTVYPSPDATIGIAATIGGNEGGSWWYAQRSFPNDYAISPSPQMAKTVGYGLSAATADSGSQEKSAYDQLSGTEQDAIQTEIMGTDTGGNPTAPFEASCTGQMQAALFGGTQPPLDGIDPATLSLVTSLTNGVAQPATQKELAADPDVVKAQSTWEECMKIAGYDQASTAPASALAQPGDIGSEIAVASADATCADKTGVNEAYRAAVRDWRIPKIEANTAALQGFLAKRAPQIAAAKMYLKIK